ncbi:hypothetical protein [Hymenobacter sp. PAMC 26628]|uniref:hypothetical protein n=1 Tax=Hymenobacter sp. PAMC 26628 TaxID=1484118 RepID=UPI0012FF727F|nr:hypothetical protein [Hymenobacter sp. PAMC 26628]
MKKILLLAALIGSTSFAGMATGTPVANKIMANKSGNKARIAPIKTTELVCAYMNTPCNKVGSACGETIEEFLDCYSELCDVLCG